MEQMKCVFKGKGVINYTVTANDSWKKEGLAQKDGEERAVVALILVTGFMCEMRIIF